MATPEELAAELRRLAEERVGEMERLLREFLPEGQLVVGEKRGRKIYALSHDELVWILLHRWVIQQKVWALRRGGFLAAWTNPLLIMGYS